MRKKLKSLIAIALGMLVLLGIIGGGIAIGKRYGHDILELLSLGNSSSVESEVLDSNNNSSKSSSSSNNIVDSGDEIITITVETDHLEF